MDFGVVGGKSFYLNALCCFVSCLLPSLLLGNETFVNLGSLDTQTKRMIPLVSFLPHGSQLICGPFGDAGTQFQVWDWKSRSKLKWIQFRHPKEKDLSRVLELKSLPDGRLVTRHSSASTGKITVWKAGTFQFEKEIHFQEPVVKIAISPKGTLLAVGTVAHRGRCAVKIYDLKEHKILHILAQGFPRNGGYGLASLEFSPDGKYVAGMEDLEDTVRRREIRVWEVSSGHLVALLPGGQKWSGIVCFSPDSQSLYTTTGHEELIKEGQYSIYNSISRYDLKSLKVISQWKYKSTGGNDDSIVSMVLGPAGKSVVIGTSFFHSQLLHVNLKKKQILQTEKLKPTKHSLMPIAVYIDTDAGKGENKNAERLKSPTQRSKIYAVAHFDRIELLKLAEAIGPTDRTKTK